VLATPKFFWLFPSFAAVGALASSFFAGRRWMQAQPDQADTSTEQPIDKYVDKLDDEPRGHQRMSEGTSTMAVAGDSRLRALSSAGCSSSSSTTFTSMHRWS
jgi:hypothetical protein